jgi:hypothetical protein
VAKSVQDYSFGIRPIGNNKVKLGEEFSLADLALIQLFYYYENLEVFIVCDDLK